MLRVKQDVNSWRIALVGISVQTQVPLETKFFCLDILDHSVQYNWTKVPPSNRVEMFQSIVLLCPGIGNGSPSSSDPTSLLLWKKASTLLAMIALISGNECFPNGFFPFIINIAMNNETKVPGTLLLSIACEEFRTFVGSRSSNSLAQSSAPRSMPIFSSTRKSLQTSFDQAIPSILSVIKSHLMVFANEIQQGINQRSVASLAALEAFNCLDNLVSWINLQQFAESGLTDIILSRYVYMSNLEHGSRAIGCIREAIDRTYIPKELEQFLLGVSVQTMEILDKLTETLNTKQSAIDEEYVSLFTQFVLTYLQKHLDRILLKGGEIISKFLTSFYNFTLAQPALSSLLNCLDGWLVFIERVNEIETKISNGETQVNMSQITPNDYCHGLNALSIALFQRILWRQSAQLLLQFMDDDEGDEDDGNDNASSISRSGTPRQIASGQRQNKRGNRGEANVSSGDIGGFDTETGEEEILKQEIDSEEQNMPISDRYVLSQRILELISKICQLPISSALYIDALIGHVSEEIVKETQSLGKVSTYNGNSTPSSASSAISDDIIAARDISTYFALVGHLSLALSSGQEFQKRFKTVSGLVNIMIEVAQYCSKNRTHTRGSDFVLLHESSLFCLARLHVWFRSTRLACIADKDSPAAKEALDILNANMNAMIIEISQVLTSQQPSPFPEKVMLAATNLFFAIGSRITPFSDISWVHQFIGLAPASKFASSLPIRVQERLYVGILSNILVFANRNNVAQVSESLYSLLGNDVNFPLELSAQRSLKILTVMIRFVSKYETYQKEVLLKTVHPSLQQTVLLAQGCVQNITTQHGMIGVLTDALGLIQAFFITHRKQLPANDVKATLSKIVKLFDAQSPLFTLSGGAPGSRVLFTPRKRASLICKLLMLFSSLMEEPTNTFDDVIGDILNITLRSIYERYRNEPQEAPDIFPAVYNVVRHVLFEHWNWFTTSVQNSANALERTRVIENQAKNDYYVACMTALVEAVQSQNTEIYTPEIIKFSLKTLVDLNKKHNLFQFNGFAPVMRTEFINILMTTIANRSRVIVEDEMLEALHGLVSSAVMSSNQSLLAIFQDFLLTRVPQLPQEAQKTLLMNLNNTVISQQQSLQRTTAVNEVDAINDFLNDLRCFEMITL